MSSVPHHPTDRSAHHGPLQLSSCVVDLVTWDVLHDDGRSERLTDKQAGLLEYLADRAHQAVSRDELHTEVWGYAPGVVTRAADTAVADLRKKIEREPTRPDHVLTVFGEGYRFAPHVRRAPDRRTNLPARREPFVGRTRQLGDLRRALSTPGWWTLVGPPGVGKTRLARALARDVVAELRGGAWFCDLSRATDTAGVVLALGAALGLPQTDNHTVGAVLARIARVLSGRGPTLLVLDNAEQVASDCAAVCTTLLTEASSVRVLVTSRQDLGGAAEQVVALEPPDLDDAVALFEVLAVRARPEVDLAEASRRDIEDLVERLDRLPLALVLAAARLSAMSVPALLQRVHQRFRLLHDRRRDAVDRQRTLRGALDWSWDALEPRERNALAMCGAFRGGFTTPAAVAVLELADPIPVLDELRRRSLLTHHDGRYGMLASIQEYAADHLAADPATETAVFERHGRFYARLAPTHRDVAPQAGVIERPNLHAALARAVTRADAPAATATAAALAQGYELTGPLDAGIAAVEDALGVGDVSAVERATLHTWRGVLRWRMGHVEDSEAELRDALAALAGHDDLSAHEAQARSALGGLLQELGRNDEARAHHEAVLALQQACGNRAGEAHALSRLGILDHDQGRTDEARASYERALAAHRATDDRRGEAIVLGNLAILLREQGSMDDAQACSEAALDAHAETGDRRGEAIALLSMGNLHREQGRPDASHACLEASLRLARAVGDRRVEGVALGNLGSLLEQEGQLERARDHLRAALALHREVGNRASECVTLQNLGSADLEASAWSEARAALTEALRIARELGAALLQGTALRRLGRVALGRGELALAHEHFTAAEGVLRALDHRLELGKLWCNQAQLCLAEARPDEARALLAEAAAARDALGADSESELSRDVVRVGRLLDEGPAGAQVWSGAGEGHDQPSHAAGAPDDGGAGQVDAQAAKDAAHHGSVSG